MVSGQKCHTDKLRKQRLCMTEEDKEKCRVAARLYGKKNKEKTSERRKKIYRISKEYANKHKC